MPPGISGFRHTLGAGDFARLAYRLGRSAATGVLTVHAPWQRSEILVLRRGALVTTETDVAGRAATARLARIAAVTGATATFDGGAQTHPPGARGLPLVVWARQHLEAQLDQSRADAFTAELAGARLSIRSEQALDPAHLDEADRRILAAMAQPRRLDQIWPLARTPRFRLLCFLHFLRHVGALTVSGVAAAGVATPHRIATSDPRQAAALRTLGLSEASDRETVKRAYRRLARALHPDLQPGVPEPRRRELEARLREVTAAAQSLLAGTV
ncbi:MAG: J domain-containing protein [Kofleriaceae bacterium]|nr:J domain-containing protein [Kofleriaceae bacterium]MCL4222931.1 J domain-containing protein [Myxococcales bacterium]